MGVAGRHKWQFDVGFIVSNGTNEERTVLSPVRHLMTCAVNFGGAAELVVGYFESFVVELYFPTREV